MILIGKPARVILRFLEDAERLIAAFVPPKSGGTCLGAIAKEYDAPMTPRLDWLHYQVGTHQSDGTFHSLCQRSKRRTTTTLRSSQARKIFSVTVIVPLLPKPKCDEQRQGEGEERKSARAENGRLEL
jgi:hypothetical protein